MQPIDRPRLTLMTVGDHPSFSEALAERLGGEPDLEVPASFSARMRALPSSPERGPPSFCSITCWRRGDSSRRPSRCLDRQIDGPAALLPHRGSSQSARRGRPAKSQQPIGIQPSAYKNSARRDAAATPHSPTGWGSGQTRDYLAKDVMTSPVRTPSPTRHPKTRRRTVAERRLAHGQAAQRATAAAVRLARPDCGDRLGGGGLLERL